jgi:hypothetical protein
MMNNINLHNRLPKDLPDKETIEDILLELKDTKKFEIKWVNLDNMSWRADNKVFHNWLEKGEVIICEMDMETSNFSLDPFETSTIRVKETRYDIFRHPIRLDIKFEAGILSLNEKAVEIVETSKDVYLRLKDYLGPDVIQDQFSITDFIIDFMLTSCRIK